jgi:hypothetical protein
MSEFLVERHLNLAHDHEGQEKLVIEGSIEGSIRELLVIGVELGLIVEGERRGPEIMVDLLVDNIWTHVETVWRLEKLLKEEILTLTPQGHFDCGDAGPLLELLRKGEANPELQAWLADMIEEGGFAQRKTWIERMNAMGALGEAIVDLEFVETLLRERGPRRGAHDRAMRIVALRYHVKLKELQKYFKRGGKDRHRVIKRMRSPFEL